MHTQDRLLAMVLGVEAPAQTFCMSIPERPHSTDPGLAVVGRETPLLSYGTLKSLPSQLPWSFAKLIGKTLLPKLLLGFYLGFEIISNIPFSFSFEMCFVRSLFNGLSLQ